MVAVHAFNTSTPEADAGMSLWSIERVQDSQGDPENPCLEKPKIKVLGEYVLASVMEWKVTEGPHRRAMYSQMSQLLTGDALVKLHRVHL